MDVVLLARAQFALTVMFHFLFPPITIGLALLITIIETLRWRTGKELYRRASDFWLKVFAVNFVVGVATGIVMEFQLLLTALILRAVSLEFQSKVEAPTWRAMWDAAFAFGSFVPALLFGVAIGNVVRGVPIGSDGEFAGTFLGLLNPFSVSVGLLSVAMFLMQGASWLSLRTEDALRARAVRAARGAWIAFAALWVLVTIYARFEAPHLWTNYASPLTWIAPLVCVALVAAYPFVSGGRAFLISSLAIAALIAIMGQALYPFMVPALGDLANSLTIRNASSTPVTLKVMLAIALLGMPFVVGYTIWIYRSFLSPVVLDEHSY